MMAWDKFELNITCRGTLEFTLMFYTLAEHLLFTITVLSFIIRTYLLIQLNYVEFYRYSKLYSQDTHVKSHTLKSTLGNKKS